MTSYADRAAQRAAHHEREAAKFARRSSRQFTLARQLIAWRSEDAAHWLGAHCQRANPSPRWRGDQAVLRALALADKAEKHRRRAERQSQLDAASPSAIKARGEAAQRRLRALGRAGRMLVAEFTDDWTSESGLSAHAAHKLLRRLDQRSAVDPGAIRLHRVVKAGKRVRQMPVSDEQPGFTATYTVVEDAAAGRVQVIFRRKPSAEMRSHLAITGFSWCPDRTAFVLDLAQERRSKVHRNAPPLCLLPTVNASHKVATALR